MTVNLGGERSPFVACVSSPNDCFGFSSLAVATPHDPMLETGAQGRPGLRPSRRRGGVRAGNARAPLAAHGDPGALDCPSLSRQPSRWLQLGFAAAFGNQVAPQSRCCFARRSPELILLVSMQPSWGWMARARSLKVAHSIGDGPTRSGAGRSLSAVIARPIISDSRASSEFRPGRRPRAAPITGLRPNRAAGAQSHRLAR